MDTLADFFKRALVWPDPDARTGWVNLHWRSPDRKGITGGQAFKTLEDVLGFIQWSQTTPKGKQYVADLYYCTSLQAERGDPKQSGRYSALRSIDNAVSSKLLFADVDKYATKAEAFIAIKQFCETSGSPYPTALVDSGGGVHAYWILPEPLSKDLWLATSAKFDGLLNQYGLKHDNISTDMARILRPPGTFNFKQSVPRPVVLKLLNGDVDLDAWESLKLATPTTLLLRNDHWDVKTTPDVNIDPPPEASVKAPASFFKGHGFHAQVTEGVIAEASVLEQCPMFVETLASGGEKVQQPVWHQQALACTFFSDGRDLFHKLGRKHPGYSKESSDEMYDRKVRDRTLKQLGYPSCASFEANGCQSCKTCPLKGKVKSPLNIAPAPRQKEAAATKIDYNILPAISKPAPVSELFELPQEVIDAGFYLKQHDNGERFIWFREGKKPEEQLLGSVLLDCHPCKGETDDGIGVQVTCTSDYNPKKKRRNIRSFPITPDDFSDSGAGIYRAMNEGGCIVMTNPMKLAELMTKIRYKISGQEEAERMVAFGWMFPDQEEGEDQGEPTGFAYSGTVYKSNGKTRSTFGGDEDLKRIYSTRGSPTHWLTAMRYIQDMASPALETVVLSAFAAPLMIFSGQPSCIIMCRGQSGGGKSTASAIAAAVWAEPRRALIKPSASKLALMKRTSKVRHMPAIWDDVRDDMFELVKDTLMEITQGGEGLKLDANRDEREQGTWDNILVTTSNSSLLEYLSDIAKGNSAGLYRCFEFEVPEITSNSASYVNPHRLSQVIAALDHHHGWIGLDYAKMIATKPAALKERYEQVQAGFMEKIAPYEPPERYYMAACSTTLMAAELFNDMEKIKEAGLQINIPRLEAFLIDTYKSLRTRLSENNHSDTSKYIKHWMSTYFNQEVAPRNEMVWTQDIPQGRGKPVSVNPIWPLGIKLMDVRSVSVRWCPPQGVVRIARGPLEKFLKREKVSIDRFREGLKKFYGAEMNPRGRMAGGIINVAAQGQEAVYEIQVRSGSWLDSFLQLHTTGPEPLGIVLEPPPQIRDQQEPRPPVGHTDSTDATDAS